MTDSLLPPLPPDAETQTVEQVSKRPRRRRRRDEPRLASAGHALVICVLGLALALVLNAPGAHKRAYNQPEGWKRDVALAVTGPLETVASTLLLDLPRRFAQAAIGRSGVDRIDTEIALPEAPAPTTPRATPTTPARKEVFTPARRLRFWVAGDSLVVVPGQSIVRASGASPVLESVGGIEGRIATGLSRPDVFNWFAEIRRQLRVLRPELVIFGFGGNDDKT